MPKSVEEMRQKLHDQVTAGRAENICEAVRLVGKHYGFATFAIESFDYPSVCEANTLSRGFWWGLG